MKNTKLKRLTFKKGITKIYFPFFAPLSIDGKITLEPKLYFENIRSKYILNKKAYMTFKYEQVEINVDSICVTVHKPL
jgi:hypothetical protein